MTQPLVSIVIPTYNGEKYVAQAIQSCLDQTHRPLEIIVSDDASTDGTLDIVRSFMTPDRPIRLIAHEKNLGIVKNAGGAYDQTQGEFVIGLSHDDFLPPHHVERMLKWFSSDDICLVHCNAMRIDGEGNEIRFSVKDVEGKIRETQNPMKALYVGVMIQSCGLMFRKSAYLDIGGLNESYRHCSEWDAYIRYAEKYKFAYATDTYGYYRVHETNVTKKLGAEYKEEHEAFIRQCRAKAFARANFTPLERLRIRALMAHKKLRIFSRKLRGKA